MPIVALLLLIASVISGLLGVSDVSDLGTAIAQIFFWTFLVSAGVVFAVNATESVGYTSGRAGPRYPARL